MKPRLMLVAALGAVLLAPAAFAAGNSTGPAAKSNLQLAATTPAQRCMALEGQWQMDGMALKSHAKFTEAEELADQGKQLCADGKPVDGMAKLGQALRDLGLKPKA
jgi:hypothetical protein